MAECNTHAGVPSKVEGEPGQRVQVAMEAAWETEAIAGQLLAAFKAMPLDSEDLHLRSLAIRLDELASIIMGALNDEMESPRLLRQRLTGIVQPRTDAGA